MSEMLPAMILAGGRATRMNGRDKPLLPLAGRPILSHLLDRLSGQAMPVALNANGDVVRFAGFGLPVRADRLPTGVPDHPGPLAGVLAAMDWAAELGVTQVLSVAGDTPFLPDDLAKRLIGARGPSGLALAATRDAIEGDAKGEDGPRLHPVCALWPVALRPELARFLVTGGRRVRDFTARHQPGLALWPARPDPFANVNTAEDLIRAEARLAAL